MNKVRGMNPVYKTGSSCVVSETSTGFLVEYPNGSNIVIPFANVAFIRYVRVASEQPVTENVE